MRRISVDPSKACRYHICMKNSVTDNQTPLMKQYWEIKSAHPDKILLFRMGDFFEMFFDDAIKAAPILGIALTQRNKKSADETPMCGMPHHSIATPINKLLAAGYKVAICDQIEDPKQAKGIVKRAVTRVMTPGMVFDSETLEATRGNYLVCLEQGTLAFLDSSTGEAFYYTDIKEVELRSLCSLLVPSEIVVNPSAPEKIWENFPQLRSECEELYDDKSLPMACRRLLGYASKLAGQQVLTTFRSFEKREFLGCLELSPTVLRHLEIFETFKGDKEGTLYRAIDRTRTSPGARRLRQWMCFPLRDQKSLADRQDQIQHWTQNLGPLKQIREILTHLGDMERRLGRISNPAVSPRDLQSLASSLRAAGEALRLSPFSNWTDKKHQELLAISELIDRTLLDELPISSRQGHVIRAGVSTELDEYVRLATDSQSLLQEMETREKDKTGISSLKIRYNQVFGYYIEVTHTHKDRVPAHYMRKQTLTNAERYCTDELVELEKKVLSAQSKRNDLESALFEQLRQHLLKNSSFVLQVAKDVAELDVMTALAFLALEQKYSRPVFGGKEIRLLASRHPVVEQMMRTPFVANDIVMAQGACALITGPNMAGKSTLMRQVAVTALLAQMGSFVPAREAYLPLFDRIFTRIGASDHLTEGLSTFMVEMKETAEMLEQATPNSLLVLDEVGRGTSTFDGMSLAQSILEFLLSQKRCSLFFATHYHELTVLENSFPQIQNWHMTVTERNGEIQFLHTLVKGRAQRSYGIQVAELAGLPREVTKRAKGLLKDLESQKLAISSQLSLLHSLEEEEKPEVSSPVRNEPAYGEYGEYRDVVSEIKSYPLTQKTPLEALGQIAKWQESLS